MYDLAVLKGSVYRKGAFEMSNVYVLEGVISKITSEVHAAKNTYDASGKWVLPGLIDPHVHLGLDLGLYKSADDFYEGSKLAAQGGYTTVLDFLAPIGDVQTLKAAFEARLKEAEGALIDYGFHATLGDFSGDVPGLVAEVKALGMTSVKVFTTYRASGRMVSDSVLKALLDQPILTMVHAEADALVDEAWQDVATYADSRPLVCETKAIDHLLSLKGQGHLYVVHVSSGSGVRLLSARDEVIIESCPQYFYFDEGVFKGRDGSLFLLAPAFRSEAERLKLIEAWHHVHTVGTDHCSFKVSEKTASKDASKIPKGIGTLPYGFLLMYQLFGTSVIDKMTSKVADVMGLDQKGRIEVGKDADLVIFDPFGETKVVPMGGSDYTVYEGMTLKGKVEATLLRGHFVLKAGQVMKTKGKYLRRCAYGEHHQRETL